MQFNTVKIRLSALADAKKDAEKATGEARKYTFPQDEEHDMEAYKLKARETYIQDNVDGILKHDYSFIEKYRPRKINDDAILELWFAERALREYTKDVEKTTRKREKHKLVPSVFSMKSVPSSVSWASDDSGPHNVLWKLRFRCLKPKGHETSWDVIGFHALRFLEWWWKGRVDGSDGSTTTPEPARNVYHDQVIWEDFRTLARKVFYLTRCIDSECMKRSFKLNQLKKVSTRATDMTVYLESLLITYTRDCDGLRIIFEVFVPIIYISSKVAIEAYGVAESEHYADGPLNSRIENRLNIIDSLLCKANNLLLSLGAQLKGCRSSFFSLPDTTEPLLVFSPEMVMDMSERLCIEAGIVKDENDYQARLERKIAEANCHSGSLASTVSSEPSTDIIPPSDLHVDVSTFTRLGVSNIEVIESTRAWIGEGSYGEVHKLGLRSDLGVCAVKIFKPTKGVKYRLDKEVSIWAHLEHRNILPLLGFTQMELSPLPALVSPYCLDNLKSYLEVHRKKPYSAVDKSSKFPELRLLHFIDNIARGLSYLHSNDIAHGDLRAVNVLVREEDDCSSVYAVLCDFGLSVHTNEMVRHITIDHQRTNEAWLSPELMIVPECEPRATKSGDVWAFGCTLLEVQYGTDPFENVDYSPSKALASQSLPTNRERLNCLRESHWNLMTMCWSFSSEKRPNMARVSLEVKKLIKEASALPDT